MASSTVSNPIKDLHELLQKKGEPNPVFDFQEEEDGKKNKVFVCTVKHREYIKVGRGSSKKIAQHEAANLLLQTLTSSSSTKRTQTKEVIGNTKSSSEGINQEQSDKKDGIPEPYFYIKEDMMEDDPSNYVVELHELLQRNQVEKAEYNWISPQSDLNNSQVYECTATWRTFICKGTGKSKNESKQAAAAKLLMEIKSDDSCAAAKAPNYIVQLHELVQKKQMKKPDYTFQEFQTDKSFECTIQLETFQSKGQGKSKNAAKLMAAANMLKKLQESKTLKEDSVQDSVRNIRQQPIADCKDNNKSDSSTQVKNEELGRYEVKDVAVDLGESSLNNPMERSVDKSQDPEATQSQDISTAVSIPLEASQSKESGQSENKSESEQTVLKDVQPSNVDVGRVQDPAAKTKGREEMKLGMSKKDRDRLQEKREFLLDSITDDKSLIDGLFSRKILNHRMKENIEGEKTKTDRLRALLDTLPRRGADAFQAFCDVLVKYAEYDAAVGLCPELADKCKAIKARSATELQPPQDLLSLAEDQDELPEGWPDQYKHDPFRINVVLVQKDNVQMQNRFKRAVSGDSHVYPVFHASRGIVLIINNMNFEEARNAGNKLSNRDGSDKDKMSLDMLFEQLGFKQRLHRKDCKAQEMLSVLQEQIAEIKNASTFDCFVLVVLSHGERGMVYGVDGKLVQIDRFLKIMDSPVLVSKPKLLFIQACQGVLEDIGIPAKYTGDQETVDQTLVEASLQTLKLKGAGDETRDGSVPSEADTFLAQATVPDYVSWRDTTWGTWFIQAVVYVFSRYAHKYNLLKLMTMVNQLVSHGETYHHKKQISTFEIRLTPRVLFCNIRPSRKDSPSCFSQTISGTP